MKSITVFTPTFNRAYLLPRLYKSLYEQSSKDFLWLIIDDGSTDETVMLVDEWILENKIQIQYVYKENGGMHTGHNLAYSLIKTELNICIDSDDFMPVNSIEKILNKSQSIIGKKNLAGIAGLDATSDGHIIGTKFPIDKKVGDLYSLYQKNIIKGDKKIVLKTKIVNKYKPYPEYKSEKLVPLGILYLMIGLDYDFLFVNEVYCIVEYQNQGSSQTIVKQYFQSPRGFMFARKIRIQHSNSKKDIFKNLIHLGVCFFILLDFKLVLKDNKYPVFTILLLPLAFLLYLYLKLIIK
jgi:glycosyltransferase involved in cell wall biosynthesis